MSRPDIVHIGCGAGFSGDRVDGAVAVVESLAASGQRAYLMYETLAEEFQPKSRDILNAVRNIYRIIRRVEKRLQS